MYGLVINGGEITTNQTLHAVYNRFLINNPLEPDGMSRAVPVNAVNIAVVMFDLFNAQAHHFLGSVLARVFNNVIAKLNQPTLPPKPDLMEKTWLNTIDEERFPVLDLKETEGSAEPAEDEAETPDKDKPDDNSKPK